MNRTPAMPALRLRRSVAAALGVAVVAATLAAAGGPAGAAAGGVPGKPATGRLSARLAALAGGGARSRAAGGPADNTPGGLRRSVNGKVVVDVDVEPWAFAGVEARMETAGATVLAVSEPALHTVTASVPDAALDGLSRVPGVRNVRDVVTPVQRATCSPVVSEGDALLAADQARAAFGVDGSGVTVGILSDSFDRSPAGAATNAAADVAAGDLPGPANPCGHLDAVNKVNDSVGTGVYDEGRAMAQTVHDLAPGARIAFATAYISETSFASNITALVNAGAKVIVDDVGYYNEPFYQDGPVAVAVNNAKAAGVAFFSAAGNNNMIVGGRDVGSYEALSYRGAACPTLPYPYLDCHGFDGAGTDVRSQMVVPNGRTLSLDLQWAQPRGNVTTDYDLFLVDASNGAVLDQSVNENNGLTGTQQAYEAATWTNTTGGAKAVDVVVARYAGPGVRFRWIQMGDAPQSVEYSTTTATDVFGPTVYGHSGTSGAVSVGAVPYWDATAVEPYSSRGPVTLLFDPVPATTALASAQVLAKPDVAATDCVRNSFFYPGSGTPHRFCGTSDAAPHAAAVAALALSLKGGLAPVDLLSSLSATAAAVGSVPATAVGAGLVNAVGTLTRVAAGAAFTSAAQAVFTEGVPGSFTVAGAGPVAPVLALATGSLPAGVSFNPLTGVLSGTPAAGSAGSWPLVFSLLSGLVTVRQNFVLTVRPASSGTGGTSRRGYWLAGAGGSVYAFGDAPFLGSAGSGGLNQPIVATAATPSGNGYWLAARDGGIFAFGDARFFGSTGSIRLNQPIVAMVATPSGGGYWLVAADGGIFAFGDARFSGSTGAMKLNRPIVAMAATPSGNGYWLVASDGGIFAFGDARFFGSTGAIHLNQPVVTAAATPSGNGYWLVASDGGIFAFGDAPFFGSTGSIRLNQPIVTAAATPSGGGYWLVASDGGMFAFGDAPFLGSTASLGLSVPIVGVAVQHP
ncbi:MAG TPA: S8 family serine peptidase [Acidimicrobiales bacterium]|nr:S8 family serine peptidase [Acidimicrobiales bacterium]